MKPDLQQKFTALFNQPATRSFFAPGRVNLIGEHIDYNGGLVLPCSITFGTNLLVAENKEGIFRFRSLDFEDQLDIPMQGAYTKKGKEWFNYPLGVMQQFLLHNKQLKGLDMLFKGDVPIGSGLSSSASIEIVTAFALNETYQSGFSKLELVQMCKKVENDFIGVNSGIMDQFAVAFGEKDKAIELNCDTLDYKIVDCKLQDYVLAIINTNKPRKLSESKYNERVEECQTALKDLQKELQIDNLCDIDTATFNKNEGLIENETVKKRARHVIEENDRVKEATHVLADGNLKRFGELLYASHASLKDLYEVTGKELDTIVEFCKTQETVAGARMTGAGFGGCAIALVKHDAYDDFAKKLTRYYTEKVGYEPAVYHSLIGDGVKEE
ncbi:galactokinase [Mucilaginibacter arboris]|uniref:Galactokinase n=1 Tax=Mucilaginibacter arboris TaxID=2682090 RepID=A0A7K1SW38_9SPHI|nr:galactokinase [Mucilaginibacter arboris]MVN21536.1 galactokinase [Mucilaginibacter arboris]